MRTRLRPGRLRNRLRSRRCVPHGGNGARGSRPRGNRGPDGGQGWKGGVATTATTTRGPPPAVLRHQPSSPRRLRGRLRTLCFVRSSAGLRTHGHGGQASSCSCRFPGQGPSANGRFVPNYRCGAVPEWPSRRHRASLSIRWRQPPPEPTGHKIVGVHGRVNANILWITGKALPHKQYAVAGHFPARTGGRRPPIRDAQSSPEGPDSRPD